MTTLRGDILNRVRRLPKPTQASEALQPLFEAVSNALHAVEDAYSDKYQVQGRIIVTIKNLKNPDTLEITIADNGIGFDARRYDAFCTTDTDHKISRGGKGIGRLLWLDAFDVASIDSIFIEDGRLRRRRFLFVLTHSDQITGETVEIVSSEGTETGTTITLRGLRGTAYRSKFPIQPATLIKHFGSHFFADFILGKTPQITLDIDDFTVSFPQAIAAFRVEDRGTQFVETAEFGPLLLASFICRKEASANFEGLHQMHLVANGRTVVTRKIDGLVGIGRFGEEDDLVYHGCVTSEFLDERVNQERTQFNFDESVSEQIVRECANYARDNVLNNEITAYDSERLVTMKDFVTEYPSFGFEEPEKLLARTPKNAVKPEQFAQALIPIRIRRDKERNDNVKHIVAQLAQATEVPEDFSKAVRKAADEVRAEEQRQLTEYVLRRKIVLSVLEVLIRRIRERNDAEDEHHLESTLHQFICPMRGYDAGKRVKGRKVHALVDTEGLPLRVVVHSAAIQDRDGAALVFDRIRQRFNWLELVWADGGYNARQVEHAVAAQPPLRVEIVKRPDGSSGFIVLPRRWVVERTFSWFGRNRRLAKDYENLADTLAAFITLACIQLAVRRLARP